MNKIPWEDRSWSGLLVQLFFFVVLPMAIVLLAISFISQALHEQEMRSMVGERDERAIQAAAKAIDAAIRERIETVRLISLQAESIGEQNLEAVFQQTDFLREQFDDGLAVIPRKGNAIELLKGDGSLQALAEELRVPSRTLFEGELPYFLSDAFTSSISGNRMLIVLYPSPGREYLAAGAIGINLLTQQSLEGLLFAEQSTTVFLVDRAGQVVNSAGHDRHEGNLLTRPGVDEALRGLSGTTYSGAGSDERVVSYASIPILGWGLVSEEAWGMVSTGSLRATQLAPLILVPFIIFMLVALWFGAQQIVKPLRLLEERTARLAWGDYQAIQESLNGLTEIRSLQAGLAAMTQKVQAAQQGMQEYVGTVTAAQEDERRRLAQELHDGTIQSLIGIKQRGQILRMQAKSHLSEQELSQLNELLALAEQTIENLRRQVRALRPIYLDDLGLKTALEILCQETSQTASIPVYYRQTGDEQRLAYTVELALYRITQEALNNITWHAQAKNASVELAFGTQETTLTIEDNGIGFQVPRSPAEFAIQGHFGLLGIYERVDLIGGKLAIQSSPGKGTQLQVFVRSLSKEEQVI